MRNGSINDKNKNQWLFVDNFKIYCGGLWVQTEPRNPLSELIEVSELEYIGLEDGIHIYKCDVPPEELSELMKAKVIEDDHVYVGVLDNDTEQKAMLWPY